LAESQYMHPNVLRLLCQYVEQGKHLFGHAVISLCFQICRASSLLGVFQCNQTCDREDFG